MKRYKLKPEYINLLTEIMNSISLKFLDQLKKKIPSNNNNYKGITNEYYEDNDFISYIKLSIHS